MIKRLWLTGYRAYELNVYQPKDPKLKVIQLALKNALTTYLDDGLQWLITGAQMGAEQWGIQVATDLKKDYPELQIAAMLPFKDFGKQWNEANQAQLSQSLSKADFVGYVSQQTYQNPSQLKNYQYFMGQHTDGALLLYDPESPGKARYDYQYITERLQEQDYPLQLIDFYQLQDEAENLQAEQDGF